MSYSNFQSQASNHKSDNYVIIVAGGSGTRMHTAIPKQFLLLKGKPVLMHTIQAFYNSDSKPSVILVLHVDFHSYWEQLCKEHGFHIPVKLIQGGETRFHSVKNGLNAIDDSSNFIIAIHDAVRPLISKRIIESSYKHAAQYGNAIVAIKSRDSVREVRENISKTLVREEIYLIQTPQTFQSLQLKKGYIQNYRSTFTDDASVVEATGVKINLIEGSYKNLKITFPEDIGILELLMHK